MTCIIQKFGGTSLANLDCIQNVALQVRREVYKGNKVVVVVSAMAGVTNQLVDWVRQISNVYDPKEYDVVASSGEQVVCGLLALALQELNVPARSWLAWQLPIETDEAHSKGRIKDISIKDLQESLDQGVVGVVAGFQGLSANNRITTLGRGGSDTTAAALAAILKAERCDIYTDVDGIYTADPRIVSKACKIEKIAYEEMLEFASQGAKVLETRSVELAMKYGVKLRVLSSFNDGVGTLVVSEEEIMERQIVSGIACKQDEIRINIRGVCDRPGTAAQIFGLLADRQINVDMIMQTTAAQSLEGACITFTVHRAEMPQTLQTLEHYKEEVGYSELSIDENIAKISIVGVGIKSHVGVAHKVFQTLGAKNINILAVTTTEVKICILIDGAYAELAVRSLHTEFGLDRFDALAFCA